MKQDKGIKLIYDTMDNAYLVNWIDSKRQVAELENRKEKIEVSLTNVIFTDFNKMSATIKE